jgi:hypothetical protein
MGKAHDSRGVVAFDRERDIALAARKILLRADEGFEQGLFLNEVIKGAALDVKIQRRVGDVG